MSEVAVRQPDQAGTDGQCRHHWLIESPSGATSMGVCKLCGAQKEFRNSVTDLLWEDEPLSELSHGRWGKSRDIPAPAGGRRDDDVSMAGTGTAGSTRLV